jgi:precorrin-6B C5,15-methyltransferase / cobalt-precorrin-6B C5,C15-methyltransferase
MACSAKVCLIGVTAGGAQSLPSTLLQRVEGADVLAGGERHLAYFPGFRGERLAIRPPLEAWIAQVAAASDAGRRVVVLATGDPLFYGIGARLIAQLGIERLEIYPHLTSLQMACARLGIPWDDATWVSVHGRPFDQLRKALGRAAKIGVLTDPCCSAEAICRWLVEHGVEEYEVAVLENLGSDAERLVRGRPSALLAETFARLNVVLLLRRVDWELPPRQERSLLGTPEQAFEHRRTGDGLITKAEIRAVTLARLQPLPTDIAWDIGAGSGAVAIEWGRLLQDGMVYAVERDAERYERLQANVRQHRAYNVVPVLGEAPECFAELPDPDGVFIGGSGGHLPALLRQACSRLRPSGRLVANFVLLEHIHETQHTARELGLDVDLVWLSVARGRPLAGKTMLEPLTPVAIVRMTQGERS